MSSQSLSSVLLCNYTCSCILYWLSGVVVNQLVLSPRGPRGPGFASRHGQVTHIASPVSSAPRNWDTKGVFRTKPL